MKVLSVEEAIKVIVGDTENVYHRFNKKDFNLLMTALANDVDFKEEVAKTKHGEIVLEEIMPTKGFRKWCKRLLENAGMDRKESDKVMHSDFVIDNMEGLYDFFVTAVYMYMETGNKFDFHNRSDFKGSLFLKDIDESVKVADEFSPKDRSYLGKFETKKEKHKELGVKSSCPSYLKKRRLVSK